MWSICRGHIHSPPGSAGLLWGVTDAPPPTRPAPLGGTPRGLAVVAFVLGVAAFLAVDLWTKHAAWQHFVHDAVTIDGRVRLIGTGNPEMTVIDGGVRLTAVANQGAAMGLGQGLRWVFVLVSVVAVGVLMTFYVRSRGRPWYQVTLAMLLAGVLGNLYDRVVHGYVRDMLHALPGVTWADMFGGPAKEVFPWVFNVADVYLCVGVAIVFVWSLLAKEPVEQPEKPEPAAP